MNEKENDLELGKIPLIAALPIMNNGNLTMEPNLAGVTVLAMLNRNENEDKLGR